MTEKPESRHAVVTGGAGFVGSHLIERLLEDGFRVTSIDDYSSGRRSNIAHVEDSVRIIEHDVRDPLPDLVSVDQIYHLASRASPTDFESHAIDIALTNSEGTRRLYDLAVEHDATVLIASTSEVYGDPETHPQHEEYYGNVNPRGVRAPYDESKRFAEALSVAYRTEHDLDIRTARIFNTYGPRMRTDDGRVVPTFLTQAMRGEELTVHGDGTQTRSFCYVTDLVEGFRRLIERPGLGGEAVNLGSTAEITIETLAEKVVKAVDSESGITYEPRPEGDPDLRRPDISKAKRKLDWTPQIELSEGLRRTAKHIENDE
jgi:UDP-glucuronate decarboxylase